MPRYNLYPAAELQLNLMRGFSTGQAIAASRGSTGERLPPGFGFEWTEIALQEKLAGNTAIVAFGLAVVFVFLLLAALYESWLLPLAVVLIVPMCILGGDDRRQHIVGWIATSWSRSAWWCWSASQQRTPS